MKKSVFQYTGQASRTDGISDNVKKMSVSAIKEMAILAMQYPDAISLSWGLPSFKTPEHVREAVIIALREDKDIGKYAPTHGLPELRQAIAERVNRDRNWEVDPDKNIIVTAGAMEGITLALQTLVNEGEEVIITDPGFSSHYEQVTLVGGNPVGWKLIEEQGWRLDINELEKIITPKTKAIIINNPCNPVGTIFSQEDLDKVAELAAKKNIFVITDEPYDFLIFDDHKFYSIAQNPIIRNNLVMCRSLSKEYAMTGWRVGYVVAEAGLRNEMLKVHDSMVICAPRISQVAALAAITGPQDIVQEFRDDFAHRREVFCELMNQQSDLFDYVKPQGAYYVFPQIKIPGVDAYEFSINLLEKAKVVTVPGDGFGSQGAEHLRMTFCGSEEEIREAFKRIEIYKQTLTTKL